jgi:CheY-like chemotaxis protein
MNISLDLSCGTIECDPTRIRQVLTNLIDNAVKYSPDGGTISIKTQKYPDEVWVSVEDTGIGMHPDELEVIFERFHQLESGHKRSTGGLGIGLSLIRDLLEPHGGHIWAESEKGKGSIFTFALPSTSIDLSDVPVQGVELDELKTGEELFPWTGRSILIVDDVDHYHDYMRLLMVTASRLISAHNGLEAVDYARREQPDLILMDLRMPVVDGFEAIRQLKADPHTKDIPILAVSAQVMEEDKERSRELGADGYVTKPVNIKIFKEVLKDVLNKK